MSELKLRPPKEEVKARASDLIEQDPGWKANLRHPLATRPAYVGARAPTS